MNATQLLIRYGFKASDVNGKFNGQPSHAGKLLNQTLVNIGATIDELGFVSEQSWAAALKTASSQVDRCGGECLVNPVEHELPLADIDLSMRGICQWMNALGMYTIHSCDGHGRRTPTVGTLTRLTRKQIELLRMIAPEGMAIRPREKAIEFDCGDRKELLLQLAERLYEIHLNPCSLSRYEAEQFKHRLIEWLSVPGESGKEAQIRQLLRGRLRSIADDLFVDRAGNLCAAIYCGEGPTVLLSAHMDIYQELENDRCIIQEGTILRSSNGILGADDRAGIAVIMEVADNIHQLQFNGTLKIAFTVEEEIGLVGSQKLDRYFLADVDAAIVVDRRGTRDIVTSCRGVIPFCSEEYGMLFEKAGRLADMNDWKVTAGGSSDAKILAQSFGIPSVNLSAGYMNEHTEWETVDYVAAYETSRLIKSFLNQQLSTAIKTGGRDNLLPD
ncbi:M28 family peptidase [Paenibacillus sp. NEAU-GSW1]|uniref:M28 family peptidase n=1 Tax=Paenibacillus sp. NEAU-GSW1 TaxID=2682486 RepID=UPI0012E1FC8C|nr:M28 family peptidase [Paenibacillus sp. NEAU-GSW1]